MRWRRDSAQSPNLFLLAAAACLTSAVILTAAAGLPDRATYTGIIQPDGALTAPEIGAVAPPFQTTTAGGTSVDLTDLRGTPVIINFWATWCEPCRIEMPALQAVYRRHQANGLRVLAINLRESPEIVLTWGANLGLTFDLLLDQSGQIAASYHLRGQPSTYILSPAGTITHIFYGPTDETTLEAALAPFLNP